MVGVLSGMVESVWLHAVVLNYMVGSVELDGGSVGLYGWVLGDMVKIVDLHCGECWVTWWGVGLHGGV